MKIAIVPAVALCAVLTALIAQSDDDKPPQRQDQPENRIVLDVSRVNMLFTVSDKKGRFVTDLSKNDFEIFENRKPQSIIEFASESDLPLRLAILITPATAFAIVFVSSRKRPRPSSPT